MKKNYFLLFCIVSFTVGVSSIMADNVSPKDSIINIASHKSYNWSIAPDYAACTDADDKIQLTDGIFEIPRIYTHLGTVGWKQHSTVTITIDLGTDVPMCGFAVSSCAANINNIFFPESIEVSTSIDSTTFTPVGNLVSMTEGTVPNASASYQAFKFKTTTTTAHGRFVSFLVKAFGPSLFFFADEIEVYGILTTGLNEPTSEQRDFMVYPNPGSGLLSIQSAENFNEASIEVIDVSGRIIYHSQISGNTKKIDLKGAKSGLYLIRIISKDSVLTKKVIIR